MGWCRCTYRNCTIRSDGVTHMFHYPVFDKARCHQWLMNAQRTDFLDLKLSQLKNRVVCQHHFKDEYFMNYKKEKLTMSAVPTVNGPYCASKDCIEEDDSLALPVSKLESEQLTYNQKVASFKVKYRDFLINYDTLDLDCQALQLSLEENKADVFKERPTFFTNLPKIKTQPSDEIKQVLQVELVHQPSTQNSGTENVNPNNIDSQITPCKPIENYNSEDVNLNNVVNTVKPTSVKILKVENVLFPNNYFAGTVIRQEQFPYNVCLVNNPTPLPNIELYDTSVMNILPDQKTIETGPLFVNPEIISETESSIKDNKSLLKPQNNTNCSSIQKSEQSVVKSTILGKSIKVKLSPEEYAKIEEKRRLNRTKIKDMMVIEQLDGQNKKPITINETQKPILHSCNTQATKINIADTVNEIQDSSQLNKKINKAKNLDAEKVSQFLSKEPALPTLNEYTVASLTNKLQRMEELLLNKIDQNARRINELKDIVNPKPEAVTNQSAFTQTNMEEYKKYLFDEISVFLKSETKSQIYEELFINKHSIKKSCRRTPLKSPQTAKRRRR